VTGAIHGWGRITFTAGEAGSPVTPTLTVPGIGDANGDPYQNVTVIAVPPLAIQ
jgi:hypothetical protein